MARTPERNHGDGKESGFLKTRSKLVLYDNVDQQK